MQNVQVGQHKWSIVVKVFTSTIKHYMDGVFLPIFAFTLLIFLFTCYSVVFKIKYRFSNLDSDFVDSSAFRSALLTLFIVTMLRF